MNYSVQNRGAFILLIICYVLFFCASCQSRTEQVLNVSINDLSYTKKIKYTGDTISFGIVSDLHFGGEPQNTIVKRLLNNIARYKVSFVVGTGDLAECDTSVLSDFNRLMKDYVDSTNIPFFCIPGNHEIDEDSPLSFPNYEHYMGSLRDTFIDVGKYRFLLVNNILDSAAPPKYRISRNALSRLTQWMSDSVHRVICTFMHAPLSRDYTQGACNECGAALYNPNCVFNNRVGPQPGYLELHKLHVKYQTKASFSGHIHQFSHDYYAACGGVNYIIAGGGCLGDSAIHVPEQQPRDYLCNNHFWLLVKLSQKSGKLIIEVHSLELPFSNTQQYTITL